MGHVCHACKPALCKGDLPQCYQEKQSNQKCFQNIFVAAAVVINLLFLLLFLLHPLAQYCESSMTCPAGHELVTRPG